MYSVIIMYSVYGEINMMLMMMIYDIWSIKRHHLKRPWTTPNPDFKVTPVFDAEFITKTIILSH